MTDPAAMPERGFVGTDTCRLVATALDDKPALGPLAADAGKLDFLARLENLTSARQVPNRPYPGSIDPAELACSADGFGWTMINAAFCYALPDGSRFNSGTRGAWYAAYGNNPEHTALAEVSWHLERELRAVGVFENTTAYRELRADFATTMHDLHGFAGEDFLSADPKIAYPAGQLLAHSLQQHGSNGVLYGSLRRKNGDCLAAFRPRIVQNVRFGSVWRLTWRPGRNVNISAQ